MGLPWWRTKQCRSCAMEIPVKAAECPYCGTTQSRLYVAWRVVKLVLIAALVVAGVVAVVLTLLILYLILPSAT